MTNRNDDDAERDEYIRQSQHPGSPWAEPRGLWRHPASRGPSSRGRFRYSRRDWIRATVFLTITLGLFFLLLLAASSQR